jgi:hypothetical protein
MDEQGLESVWMFPSHGVCVEGPMQPDLDASIEVLRAFNRWLEEDWRFAYRNRIFAVPILTLSRFDQAIAELEWCLDRGARIVSIRNGPVFADALPWACGSPTSRTVARGSDRCRTGWS